MRNKNSENVRGQKGKRNVVEWINSIAGRVKEKAMEREPGIDGILVSVGLCIVALLLCVVMKDSLGNFIETLVTSLQTKATTILNGV